MFEHVWRKTKKESVVRTPLREYRPHLPYLSRLRKEKNNDQFINNFLEIFNKLYMKLLIVEALTKMHKYVKFFKDMLNDKRVLEEPSKVTLNEDCSCNSTK